MADEQYKLNRTGSQIDADLEKIEGLANIKQVGEGLELTANGKLNAIGGGGAVAVNTSYEDSALELADSQGHIALQVTAEGHIKTKQFDSSQRVNASEKIKVVLDEREICDYYGIKNDGTHARATNDTFGCSYFIDCKGVDKLYIRVPKAINTQSFGLAFYDDNKQFISFVPNPTGESNTYEDVELTVPTNAYYFKTTYWNYKNSKTIGLFKCTLYYPSSVWVNNKRPYQTGYIKFAPIINQAKSTIYTNQSSPETQVGLNLLDTTGVLYLPESYSQNGKPCPVIIYCHGYSHYVHYDGWGAADTFRVQKQHFVDAGFAVIDCNGPRNGNATGVYAGWGHWARGGVPQDVTAFHECFEYCKQYYNIQSEPFVYGCSAGGVTAANYAFRYPVKALMQLSNYFDLDACGSVSSSAISEYTEFTSTTIASSNAGLNPAQRYYTLNDVERYPYLNFPVYGILGASETGNSYIYQPLIRFWNAMKASGNQIECRIVNTYNHSQIVSGGVEELDNEYINWMKQHI